jgi:hypothetical protein
MELLFLFARFALCVVHGLKRLSPAATEIEPQTKNSEVTPNVTTCNCYLPTNCRGRNSTCQVGGGCLPQGKNDGVCFIGTAPPSATALAEMSEQDKSLVLTQNRAMSDALDVYFKSFMRAIANGGGRPDPVLLSSALNVPLSDVGRDHVEKAVWISMDAVMGWDFQTPTTIQRAQGFQGNIREVDGVRSAGAIVDAARRGLIDAMASGDNGRVAAPLEAFWSKNPDYIPRHVGRSLPSRPRGSSRHESRSCMSNRYSKARGWNAN